MVKILKLFQKQKNEFVEIKNAEELLQPHSNLLNKIFHVSKSPTNYYNNYYYYSIKKMAELVQSLPASQAHHHSNSGGFLLHNLEVIEHALTRRNTQLLPLGSPVEIQNHKKDLWSFAVFVASIMHDIGKVITDIEVFLYDKKYKELGRWSPFVGSMLDLDNNKAKYYKYYYNPSRKYYQHKLCANMLLIYTIHPVALDWLKKDGELFSMLLNCIESRSVEGGIITNIIKYADSLSTAQSLKNKQSDSTQPQQLRPKSLADKLLDALKYLTLECGLKINEPGASIYTTPTDIYYVSKITIDLLKENLQKDKQTGIPHDNSRIMDEMLQFKIIIPNNKDKAIWSITLKDGGFKKPVKLTMIRVAIDTIYIDYPDHFSGEIIDNDTGELLSNLKEITTDDSNNTDKDIQPTTTQATVTTDTSSSSLPLPPGLELLKPKEKKEKSQEQIKIDTNTTQNKEVEKEADKNKNEYKEQKLDTTLGDKFLEWLKTSIQEESILINKPEAKIHVVSYNDKKALFLVSPIIFKEYDKANWEQVQKHFTRTKFNEKSYQDDNIWKVETTTNRTNKKPSIIKGYLITDLNNLAFSNIPSINQRIQLIIPEKK